MYSKNELAKQLAPEKKTQKNHQSHERRFLFLFNNNILRFVVEMVF